MKTVNGVYTSAKIFTDTIEDYALAQIQMLCDQEAFQGCKIRIMPDVHPGKVGTIGFTSTSGEKILPNVVGIDIGCGITLAKLKQKKVEFQKLDSVIRENVPSGFQIRKKPHRFGKDFDFSRLNCMKHIQVAKAVLSLGTLGSGNHFIEIDRDEEGMLYAAIHSGSRHLGKEVTEFYLEEGQKVLKAKGIQVPYELTWLEGELKEAYLHDLRIVQEFAALNRKAILDELVKGMKWKTLDVFSSAHNYVSGLNSDISDREDGESSGESFSGCNLIIRKGAVSAKRGEAVVIPVNMRDGMILGTGLGNEDWNESVPHGAGRLFSREEVKQRFTVAGFKAEIQAAISDTVEIQKIIRPVYNFKGNRI